MPGKIANGSRLAEMLDTMRYGSVAGDRAQPGQCRRVAIENRDQRAMAGKPVQQALDVGEGAGIAAGAFALRRRPSRVETVGRGDGKNGDIAPMLTNPPRRGEGRSRGVRVSSGLTWRCS